MITGFGAFNDLATAPLRNKNQIREKYVHLFIWSVNEDTRVYNVWIVAAN
jgi:hypothetical protein